MGIYGSKQTAPDWSLQELSNALLRLVDGKPEGVAMASKAQELGNIAKREEGRYCAAKEIIKLVDSSIV